MATPDPGDDFIRITNKMIWDRLEKMEKRLTRLEVLLGSGVLGIAGIFIKGVFFK